MLFDLDGTLVDSIELILESYRHACETELGCPQPVEEWIAGIGTPLRTQMRAYAATDTQLDALIVAYRNYQRENHDRLMRAYEGTRGTLDLLASRGHRMAVVTSKANELAERALEYTGLLSYMNTIVGCESCVHHKPDPEPVRVALGALGCDAREAVLIGDSPHDIMAGKSAGVITVGAVWGPFDRATLQRAAPDHLLEDISALPALVDQIESALNAAT